MGEKTLFISIAISQFFVWIVTTFIEIIKNMFSYYFLTIKKIKNNTYSNFVLAIIPCLFMILIIIIYSCIDSSLTEWAADKTETLIVSVSTYIIIFSITLTICFLKIGIDFYDLKNN